MSGGDGAFHTTQWTQVLSARGDSEAAREALSELGSRYYAPVVAFLRREGRSEDAARELAHAFFEWLLGRDPLAELQRERGRFRSYLLGALKHFIGHQREAAGRLKRGAGITHLAIGSAVDPSDALSLPPDREFDRQWALHVLSEAMIALESEWQQSGKGDQFEALRPFLDSEPAHGALSDLAVKVGKKEATMRSHLHRLRRAFRRQVKAQIAPTLDTEGELESEMEWLFAALGGR